MTLDNEITMLEAMLYAQEGESPSKAIENQERRGQRMVAEYVRLPKGTNACCLQSHNHILPLFISRYTISYK